MTEVEFATLDMLSSTAAVIFGVHNWDHVMLISLTL